MTEPYQIIFNNSDIINIILENINGTFNDFINLRKVNRAFNETILYIFRKNLDINDVIYGKATMVCMRICWKCNSSQNISCLNYCHDTHPSRMIAVCNKKKCKMIAFKSFAFETFSIEKKIILLEDMKFTKLLIPRSSGAVTLADVDNRFIIVLDNKLYLKFTFIQNNERFEKCCSINDLLEINSDKDQKDIFNLINLIKLKRLNIVPFYSNDVLRLLEESVESFSIIDFQ